MQKFYSDLYSRDLMPPTHVAYLEKLKKSGFEPKVIYDIGSCVLHWTRHAKRLWPDAEIILFDANHHCEFLYTDYKYYMGILSNVSNTKVKFYLNEMSPGGASYYKEIGSADSEKLYPSNRYYMVQSMRLDDVVKERGFPLPDLVKMDVQGAERDVMEGGIETLKHARHLIMEIPKKGVCYNQNAPSGESTIKFAEQQGWICSAPLFSDNGIFDGDFGFSRSENETESK